jgi:hypothetical protein
MVMRSTPSNFVRPVDEVRCQPPPGDDAIVMPRLSAPLGPAEQSGEPPLVGDTAAERVCNVPKQFFNGDGFGRLLSQKEAQSLLAFHTEWRN